MAKVFETQDSRYTEVTALAAADLIGGQYILVGVVNAFTLVDVFNTEKYAAIVKSDKVRVAKAVGALAQGAAVYYNDTSKNVSATGTDILIGFVEKAALSADTHVDIVFDGTLAFAKA